MENYSSILIGGGITLIGTIIGVWGSYFFQRKINNNDEKQKINSFLVSIKAEISNVWNRYYETVGKKVEALNENEGLNLFYPVFDNYFVVYDNNTNCLGNLDKELSEIIVKTYILAKGLKDSFVFNNSLINEIRRYSDLVNERQETKYCKIEREQVIGMYKGYGNDIRKMHFLLKENKDILLSEIDEKLSV